MSIRTAYFFLLKVIAFSNILTIFQVLSINKWLIYNDKNQGRYLQGGKTMAAVTSSRSSLWTSSRENVPLSMRKMCRLRSSCTYSRYHLGLYSPFMQFVVSDDYVSGQWRPWSECVNVQADLGLYCPHMPDNMFLHGAAWRKGGTFGSTSRHIFMQYKRLIEIKEQTGIRFKNWKI